MEPREEEDRSPERSLWADPDHKAGEKWRNGTRIRGKRGLLRRTKKKDEQQKIQHKEITKSNLKKPKSTNFPLLRMSPQISPANLFISG